MSEKNLPEVTIDDTTGFKSALFLNISEMYNSRGPKEILDSVESSRLSIESWTPGTTPKGAEKRKNESNFRFCLSRDLLQRLEEASPITVYAEKKTKTAEVFLQGCDEVNEADDFPREFTEKEIGDDYLNELNYLQTPSNFLRSHDFNFDEVAKVLNFGEESEEMNKNPYNCKALDPNSVSGNSRICLAANSSTGSTNSSDSNSVKESNSLKLNPAFNTSPYFPLSKNTKFNKFNTVFNFSVYGYDDKGLASNLKNFSPNANNMICNNVNMYGKNGWICLSCHNFNYESNIYFTISSCEV
jgi:hypothetical protein